MNGDIRHVIEFEYSYNVTVLNALSLSLTIAMVVFLIFLSRKYAHIPFLIVACFITNMQRVVIGGFDFDMLRILIFVGLLRIIIRREFKNIETCTIDKYVFFYTIFAIIMHTLQLKSSDAFINRLGLGFDVLGIYIIFRSLIQNADDVYLIIRSLIIISIPVALAMIYEQMTGRNYFSVFGGVPDYTIYRGGKLRSQGAFSHPILAGSFGASLFPLAYGFYKYKKRNILIFFAGMISATTITYTSSSSGPLIAYLGGIFFLFFWYTKNYLKPFIYTIILAALFLHIIMKDPVWALIYRFNIVSGSTGYHRFALIDQAIKHFGEWWLFGTRNMAYWGWGLQDVTNQYIRIGVDGGIIPLIFFLLLIFYTFQTFGSVIKNKFANIQLQYFTWCIGCSLFTHILSFISVSYFGQMVLFWYLPLTFAPALQNSVINNAL